MFMQNLPYLNSALSRSQIHFQIREAAKRFLNSRLICIYHLQISTPQFIPDLTKLAPRLTANSPDIKNNPHLAFTIPF